MSKEHADYIKGIDVNSERRFFVAPVTIEKRAEDEEGNSTIEGYAAKFNTRANIGNWFEEEIMPGAFDDILNDDVRCLFNHDPNFVLARSNNGKGTLKLSLDAEGLKYSYVTPNRSFAKDLEDAIASGDVSQSSFAFRAKEVIWKERADEMDLRQIVKIEKLYDVSPVTYPAYQDATVGKRSLEAFKAEKIEVNDPKEINSNPNTRAKTMDVYDAQYQFNLNKSK